MHYFSFQLCFASISFEKTSQSGNNSLNGIIYRKIPGPTFDIEANLVGLLSGGLTFGGIFCYLKFGGPTIRWANYPVGLPTGFYGMLIFKFSVVHYLSRIK